MKNQSVVGGSRAHVRFEAAFGVESSRSPEKRRSDSWRRGRPGIEQSYGHTDGPHKARCQTLAQAADAKDVGSSLVTQAVSHMRRTCSEVCAPKSLCKVWVVMNQRRECVEIWRRQRRSIVQGLHDVIIG